MPWTHLLPPNTRAAGTIDPANDANAFTEAFTAFGAGFNVQNPAVGGGADPTGVADSAPAFNAAVALLGVSPGAVYVPTAGTYRLNSTVAFTNPGQWLVCAPGVVLNSYVAGDCISMTYSGTYSGTTTRDGGIIGDPVIDGTNAPTSYAYTATNASPCVFTAAGSALTNGTQVQLTTPPTGFSTATNYFVVLASGASFSLAATFGGAAINSSSTGAGNVLPSSTGLHMGDIFNLTVNAVVQHFQGTNSKGAYFDNRYHWTEGAHLKVDAIGNTVNIAFDSTGGTNSFARMNADLYVNQQSNQWDGITLNNVVLYGCLLKFGGNYNFGASATTAASLRFTGTSTVQSSVVLIDNECAAGANTTQSINFASSANNFANCTGSMNFGQAGVNFTASNFPGSGSFFGPITGDSSLSALARLAHPLVLDMGVNIGHSNAAQALVNGSTITTAGLSYAPCSLAAAVTGIIMQAGTVDGQLIYVSLESTVASGFTLTFAAAGSNVRDPADTIAAGTAALFCWNIHVTQWIRVK